MARRLLDLRHVPLEEAAALRAELAEHDIDYYELPPSAFGISAGSIWVRRDEDWPRAREVFDRFQDDYRDAARRAPPVPPLREQLRRHPGRIIGYALAAVLILLLMGWPVLQLWR